MSIKVVVVYPNVRAAVVEIEPKLEAFQDLVGGPIEHVWGGHFPVLEKEGDGMHLYLNEEGKLNGMQPNDALHIPGDLLVGPIVVSCGNDAGEDIGLTDEQAARICKALDAVRGFLLS